MQVQSDFEAEASTERDFVVTLQEGAERQLGSFFLHVAMRTPHLWKETENMNTPSFKRGALAASTIALEASRADRGCLAPCLPASELIQGVGADRVDVTAAVESAAQAIGELAIAQLMIDRIESEPSLTREVQCVAIG